jgi:hypothetical protein
MLDSGFSNAGRIIEQSRVVRGVIYLTDAIGSAAATSRTASLVSRFRITHIGVMLTSTCVTHAALLQLMPDRIAPTKPLAYGVVLAFAALVLAVGCVTKRNSATATADNTAGTANTRKSS